MAEDLNGCEGEPLLEEDGQDMPVVPQSMIPSIDLLVKSLLKPDTQPLNPPPNKRRR